LRTPLITGRTLAACTYAGTGEIAGIKRSLSPGAPVMRQAVLTGAMIRVARVYPLNDDGQAQAW
jgi:hypothetical protein